MIKYKISKSISVLACFIFIVLGYNLNKLYYILSAAAVILAVLSHKKHKREKFKHLIEEEILNWGKKKKRKYKFNVYSSLEELLPKEKDTFRIDNQTWNDLNMYEIFKKLDTTYTIPGQQFLYKILRNISINKEELNNRNNSINTILSNNKLKSDIINCLFSTGIQGGENTASFLFETISFNEKFVKFMKIIRFAAPASLLVCFLNIQLGILLLVFSIFFNIRNYYKTKEFVGTYVDSMKYMSRIMSCSNILLNSDIDSLDIDKERLSTAFKNTLPIRRKFDQLIFANNDVGIVTDLNFMYDYLNILFLIEPIIFFDSVQYINKYREDMKFIYEAIGKIDALLSIAAFRNNNPEYCEPIFSDSKSLNIKDAYYILLDKPVKNSITLDSDRGVLITGSNMSGKSTFLRTISSSIVLAQTIATVPSSYYKADILKPFTSIDISDNVEEGDSYYLAEVKAIKRILDCEDNEIRIISFIDEIFSGTNRIERTAAAIEILDYLKKKNITAFVATHDLEITKEISGYDKYYFKEKVLEDDIIFDYTIHEGISNTSNAIEILKLVGYPNEIYEGAKEKADAMRES